MRRRMMLASALALCVLVGSWTLQDKRTIPRHTVTASSQAGKPVGSIAPSVPVTPSSLPLVTPQAALRAAWRKVAVCEEGSTKAFQQYGAWFRSGSTYPDSVGVSTTNWFGAGGGTAVTATTQVRVATAVVNKMAAHGTVSQGVVVAVGWIPDQHGCAGSW